MDEKNILQVWKSEGIPAPQKHCLIHSDPVCILWPDRSRISEQPGNRVPSEDILKSKKAKKKKKNQEEVPPTLQDASLVSPKCCY